MQHELVFPINPTLFHPAQTALGAGRRFSSSEFETTAEISIFMAGFEMMVKILNKNSS